ncbi:MAG: shikimate kinase [Candidatus Heimdallarchaeota archaeon]|nr:shikimate kinase [Candidatus Heimdallarchaeota archaeon]MDH5645086.1 shikimate kinase [Candidatus Heimdallarchaeota archaeon]
MNQIQVKVGSAITVLNGISAEYSSAIGIEIFNTIIINEASKLIVNCYPEEADDRLVYECIRLLEKDYSIHVSNIEIQTKGSLPPQRGLKTSSSISCGLITALSRYYNLNLNINQIVEYSAIASQNIEISVTGALDDAYACLTGGLSYVDVNKVELIRLDHINLDHHVLLLIPNESNPKKYIKNKLTSIDTRLIRYANEEFNKSNYIEAIKLNTLAYGPHLLENFNIIEILSNLNVKVVGLNGGGPSLFILIENDRIVINEIKLFIKTNFPMYSLIDSKIRDLQEEWYK